MNPTAQAPAPQDAAHGVMAAAGMARVIDVVRVVFSRDASGRACAGLGYWFGYWFSTGVPAPCPRSANQTRNA